MTKNRKQRSRTSTVSTFNGKESTCIKNPKFSSSAADEYPLCMAVRDTAVASPLTNIDTALFEMSLTAPMSIIARNTTPTPTDIARDISYVPCSIPVRITRSTSFTYKHNRNGRNQNILIKIRTSERNSNPNNQTNNKIRSNMPTILLTNVCHILNKVDDLHAIVDLNNPSLIMITESWLNINVPDSVVRIGSIFNIYRRDRLTPGGGILAYVNVNIPTTHLKTLEEDNKEVLWLLLKPPRTPRPFSAIIVVGVIVVGVYFPPPRAVSRK